MQGMTLTRRFAPAFLALTMAVQVPGSALHARARPVDDLVRTVIETLIPQHPEQLGADEADGAAENNPRAVVVGLAATLDDLALRNPGYAAEFHGAKEGYLRAWKIYTPASFDPAIQAGTILVGVADDSRDPGMKELVGYLLHNAASAGRFIAQRIIARATTAGVSRTTVADAQAHLDVGDALFAAAKYVPALEEYKNVFAVLDDKLTFDVEAFEQNIILAVTGGAVGYAYAIGVNGQFVADGAVGDARTEADAPSVDHSPAKEQFLASVSKTITAIAALRLLDQQGISVDESIISYLPSDWTPGPGIGPGIADDGLTFANLMTHTSGFPDGTGSAYAALKARIEAGVATSAGFNYVNANFGMFRILIPQIWPVGKNLVSSYLAFGFPPDIAYASAYEWYVRSEIFAKMGIDGRCESTDPIPTLYYNIPHGGANGWFEGSQLLGCGGFGWHLSAVELAALVAHQRYDNQILSPAMRATMNDRYLGWMDPANYASPDGDLGPYRMHGGDWYRSNGRELHTCVVDFPNGVQASLVINSKRGFPGYQCALLRDAFDDALTAN